MKINLIPITHPELDNIEIDEDIFFIGRLEEPFISFDTAITADMSRRHAKIYEDNGRLYVADMESLNGTTLNGEPLQESGVAIDDGDIIEFARHLAYKVESQAKELDVTIMAEKQQELKLALEPVDKNAGLDILVVSGFPFLISKEAGIFASFKKNFEVETNRISRRHAYVLLEKNVLKLIDMSSTNGTFINDEKIEGESPVTLKTGDVVSFAGNFFKYAVKLELANSVDNEATVLKPESRITKDDHSSDDERNDSEPRTTFVNEPSPFLDILCDEVKYHPDTAEEKEKHATAQQVTSKGKQKKRSFVATFLQQIREALAEDKPRKKSKVGYLIGLLLVSIVGAAAYFYLSDNSRDIKKLLNAEQYIEAQTLSEQMLNDDVNNPQLKELATIAKLNNVVPEWLELLNNADYARAAQILQAAKKPGMEMSSFDNAMDTLQWVGNMHQFMQTRDKNKGIVLFKDEKIINALVNYWRNNKKQNRKTLAMIARDVSLFKANYEQVLSEIRLLENDKNIYLKAISTLEADILQQLEQDQTQNLHTIVTQFENKYSVIIGFEELKLDIYHYLEFDEALKQKNINKITKLQKQYDFKTSIFESFTKQNFVKLLPSEKFKKQYPQALNFWQSGKVDVAIKQLLALSASQWGEVARKKLARYQTIVAEFNALQEAKQTQHYVDSLFEFHSLLKLPEDSYYFKMIESDFQDNKQLALEKAKTSFDLAKVHWKKYTNNGGIGGILRLEQVVSRAFKTQANHLSSALQEIMYSQLIYQNLHSDATDEIKELAMTIKSEAVTQRKWLTDLELILKPEALKKKLDLLIVLEE